MNTADWNLWMPLSCHVIIIFSLWLVCFGTNKSRRCGIFSNTTVFYLIGSLHFTLLYNDCKMFSKITASLHGDGLLLETLLWPFEVLDKTIHELWNLFWTTNFKECHLILILAFWSLFIGAPLAYSTRRHNCIVRLGLSGTRSGAQWCILTSGLGQSLVVQWLKDNFARSLSIT